MSTIDHRLRMLDPHADSKRLWLHCNPSISQHTVCIARALTNRQDKGRTGYPLQSRSALNKNRPHGTILRFHAAEFCGEPHFSAHLLNALSH
ncbi:MAG: hypothetical protein ACI4MR_06290, partial [Candidatus Aphodomorpha sp.]